MVINIISVKIFDLINLMSTKLISTVMKSTRIFSSLKHPSSGWLMVTINFGTKTMETKGLGLDEKMPLRCLIIKFDILRHVQICMEKLVAPTGFRTQHQQPEIWGYQLAQW